MTVTPTPPIDAVPPVAQRLSDTRAEFVQKMDASLAAQPTLRTQVLATCQAAELNATASEAAATVAEAARDAALAITDFVGLSSSTLNLATGSQSLTTQAGLAFSAAANHQVALVSLENDGLRLTATVTAYNSGSGAMTVNVTRVTSGVGSASGWAVMLKALEGASLEQVNALAAALAIVL